MSDERDKKIGTENVESDVIWEGKRRIWCGLPVSFTKYILKKDRLIVRTGLVNLHEDEVRLYRITDIAIDKSGMQRVFGLGTIHVVSSDEKLGNFDIENIKDSYKVKEMLSEMVETERGKARREVLVKDSI